MKIWKVLSEYINGEDIIDLILHNRGIVSIEEKERFLNPPPVLHLAKDFSPELKNSLVKAKEMVLNAVSSDIPVVIHGDYDADGICATALLYNALKYDLDYSKVYAFIPNRFDHGYGLSVNSIDEVLEELTLSLGERPKDVLIITVDSGITAVEEVRYIRSLGYRVIVTDHHQKPQELPEANEIVWTDKMVGAGIAWFLARTLGSKDPTSISLAALATVTDLQPLLDMNRSIVKEGLTVLNERPPAGLKKLLDVSGRREGDITTYDLGWVLGPRLNASGRLVNATNSLNLLIEKDEKTLHDIALDLNRVNVERQDKTLEMYEVAGNTGNLSADDLPNVIISSHTEYHEGIIGLVAARLAQKYYRPSIVISLSKVYGKGSVRSIPGVDIITILRQYEDLFESLGGHPMAAGFTIHRDNIAILEEKLLPYCKENLDEGLFEPVIDIDMKIPLNLIDLDLASELERLKPFGIGNREPVLCSDSVGIAALNIVGREANHVSMRLYDNGNTYKAIFFNGTEKVSDLKIGDRIDLVYKVKRAEFNGKVSVDLIVEDLRKHP